VANAWGGAMLLKMRRDGEVGRGGGFSLTKRTVGSCPGRHVVECTKFVVGFTTYVTVARIFGVGSTCSVARTLVGAHGDGRGGKSGGDDDFLEHIEF